MRNTCLAVVCFLLAFASDAHGEDPDISVSAELSVKAADIGESFFLNLLVEHPQGASVALQPNGFGDEIYETEKKRQQSKTKTSGNREKTVIAVELIATKTGQLTVAPQTVSVAFGGSVTEHQVEKQTISVLSVAEEQADLEDIEAPVSVLRSDYSLLWAALAVFAIVLSFWLGNLWLKHRKVTESVAAAASNALVPPLEEAMSKLREIERRGALEEADLKPAYHEMSEVFRRYLGKRFGIPALDLTTHEISVATASDPVCKNLSDSITSWLKRTDLIKFANQDTSDGDANVDHKEVCDLIESLESTYQESRSPQIEVGESHEAS